jgi:hypothetical protein
VLFLSDLRLVWEHATRARAEQCEYGLSGCESHWQRGAFLLGEPVRGAAMSVLSSPKGKVVVSIGGEKTDRNDGRRQMPRTADLNRLKQQLTGVTTSVPHRVGLIQRYIGGFTYNQTLTRHFDTSMDRPLAAILETARYILHGMYHVRCLEAVFAGIALTQQLRDVDRITLRFKSHIPSLDQMYRHIVLAVRVPSTTPGAAPVWGAIGLSREPALMNKPCRFNSLHELIEDFVKGYNSCAPSHNVVSVSVGLPISHDDWSSVSSILFSVVTALDTAVTLDLTISSTSARCFQFRHPSAGAT